VQSGERVRLRDGTKAVIRPFRPVPRAAIEKAYDELSAESRFHRFVSAVPHLTDSMLHHLVDDIDGVDHIALLLVLEPDEGPESIIGVARVIRYQDEPTSADVAVTVRDDWHGRGAATALLAALMRQRPAGAPGSSRWWRPNMPRHWPCCSGWDPAVRLRPATASWRWSWTSPNIRGERADRPPVKAGHEPPARLSGKTWRHFG
jgi:hypothetical protein